jgi:hypothetical protein
VQSKKPESRERLTRARRPRHVRGSPSAWHCWLGQLSSVAISGGVLGRGGVLRRSQTFRLIGSWAAKRKVILLKQLSVMIIAILVGIYLSACSSQVPTPPQPSIAVGSLDTAEAYLMRGDQYSDIRDYDHAIADYSQAIRLKPDYAEAYNNRGYAYYWSGKVEMANAIADYSQAIKSRPAYAYAYNNRGAAYMASGYPDEALRDFDRAIQLQPDFPQAFSNRGNAFLREGRIDLAISDFYRAGKIPLGFIAILCGILLLGAMILYRVVSRRFLAKS